MRLPRACALVFALSGAACATREDAAPRSATDSTSTAGDSVGKDSVGARSGTTPAVTTGSKSVAPPRKDSIMGRDSAFGPMFTLDANGKAVPIKKKP